MNYSQSINPQKFTTPSAYWGEKKINLPLVKSKYSQSSYTYPLLLRVNVSNAKIVFFQQAVIVADVVYEKLTFSLPL